jgi:hypothetical protein
MKAEPVNSKLFKKRKIPTHTGIYSRKDLEKQKPPKVHQQHRKKVIDYVVQTDIDLHIHLEAAQKVLDFIWKYNVRSRSVFDIPEGIRAGLQPSTVKAMIWRYAHSRRAKIQPPSNLVVYGRWTIPDFDTRRIEISREGISVKMPDELTEESKIAWIKIGEKETVVTIRIAPSANAPFNINQIPMAGAIGVMPTYDDEVD